MRRDGPRRWRLEVASPLRLLVSLDCVFSKQMQLMQEFPLPDTGVTATFSHFAKLFKGCFNLWRRH